LLLGSQKGAESPSRLWQTEKAPLPSLLLAVGRGAAPVLVVILASCLVWVNTVPVRSYGAPEMTVGVPFIVVSTGVTVDGRPEGSTDTQASVGLAGVGVGVSVWRGARMIPC